MPSRLQSIDTNIVLSIILNDEPSQKPKTAKLLLSGAEYFVPTLAITEADFILERVRKINRQVIVRLLRQLLNRNFIHYDNKLLDGVFDFYLAHPKLSFNDCTLSFEAERMQCQPLWTFDKDFAKQSAVTKLLK